MAALTCLAASLTPARAQIDIVIPVNQVWKYMATADDTNFCLNGTGWETTGYNDSAWPSGPGGFTGSEDTAATLTSLSGLLNTTSLPPPSLSSGRPQYFRTHFNLGATNGLSLIVSNRYDDQAVFYINGTRVGHFNHPADPEVCTITTASGGEATTWALIILSPAQLGGILHSGTDNVLAVSVHQNNAASGDMVFVCALSSTTNAISPPQPGPIPYGPAGSTNFTFDAAPPVQQWSTRTWYGSASDITDMAALDTAARTNVAALIDSPIPSATGNPPVAATAGTVWASDGHYLQTRPAGVAYAGLMATLMNTSGSAVSGLGINYTLTVVSPVVEEVKGHLVYYSLTGAADSWIQIPELSNQLSDNTGGVYPKSMCVALSYPWNPGQLLYFLWVDDNAFDGPDTALQFDNVQFSGPSLVVPGTLANQKDPANRTVIQCQSTTLSAPVFMGCGGPTPLLQWFKDDSAIPGATTPSYTITNMQETNAGNYFLHVTSPYGTTNSHTATVSFQPALAFALIRALGNATNASEITLSFNLSVEPSTVDGSTFTVQTRADALALSLLALVITNSTNVVLTTDPREEGVNYDVVINGPGPASVCPGTHVTGTYALYLAEPKLVLAPPDGVGDMFLSWSSGILQQAPSPAGPWKDVSPTPANPALINVGDATNRFYRLR
jgi:hypothetical protein